MNKKQRKAEAINYIIRFMEAGQHEGLIDEFGEDEGDKIRQEAIRIVRKLKQSIHKDNKS